MASQPHIDLTIPSTNTERILSKLGSGAAYMTVIIGYLLTILASPHLTVLNFLSFTILQIAFCTVFWWVVQNGPCGWRLAIAMGILAAILLASNLVTSTGLKWDWLLYLVTISIYFSVLSLRTAIILSILVYVGMALNLAYLNNWHWSDTYPSLFSLLPAYAFIAVFSLVIRVLSLQKQRADQLIDQLEASNHKLEEAHKQLQKYADEVEELTIVRERARVAREIHDTLGHYLSILNIQLETISKLQVQDPARAMVEVVEARRVAAQSMQEVRNAVAALRSTSIATLSLQEALLQLAHEFSRAAIEETELTLDLEDAQLPPLSSDIHVALYRTAQESLTNVRKHAHATKVLMRLRYEHELLDLLVLDNGIATPAPDDHSDHHPEPGGFGLIGLCERIELLGGHISYGPTQPSGYRVTTQIRVPSANSSIPSSTTSPFSAQVPPSTSIDSQEDMHDRTYSRADR